MISEIWDGQVSDGATPTTPPADVPCRISLRILGIFTRVEGSVRKRASRPAIEMTTSLRAGGFMRGLRKQKSGDDKDGKTESGNPDFIAPAAVHNRLLTS